jgi:hypothetical protein
MLVVESASAAPVDFGDTSPREISVRFEISPRELPQQMSLAYTAPLPAYLTPGVRPGEVRLIVAGALVEEHLMDRQNPVAGSFSDFVWTFDSTSGEVLSASFAGSVVRRLSWGFMTTRTLVDIEIEMNTARDAGFRSPVSLLGQLFFRHCADLDDKRCTIVESRDYDFDTGYVNAVGTVRVKSSVMELQGFSPLGEAIFSETERALVEAKVEVEVQNEEVEGTRDIRVSARAETATARSLDLRLDSVASSPHEVN